MAKRQSRPARPKAQDLTTEFSPELLKDLEAPKPFEDLPFDDTQFHSAIGPNPLMVPSRGALGGVSSGDDWRAIAQEWRAIAESWSERGRLASAPMSFSTGAAGVAAASADDIDFNKVELHFLVAAATNDPELSGVGISNNVQNLRTLAHLCSMNGDGIKSFTQLDGYNCTHANFVSGMKALATNAALAKSKGKEFRAIIHVSCHGSYNGLNLQKNAPVLRSQYTQLAMNIIDQGATGVRMFTDSCAEGHPPSRVRAVPQAAPTSLSTSGMEYLYGFSSLSVINGSHPELGPNGTGELSLYRLGYGGFFTANIFKTLTRDTFTPSDAGFMALVAAGIARDYKSPPINGSYRAKNGREYRTQTPYPYVVKYPK